MDYINLFDVNINIDPIRNPQKNVYISNLTIHYELNVSFVGDLSVSCRQRFQFPSPIAIIH